MMIVPAGVKVHLALGYTDMRKGMDGLAMLVQETLKKDPFCGHLFAFRGKRAQIVKILFWDGNGLPVHQAARSGRVRVAAADGVRRLHHAVSGAARDADRGHRLARARTHMEARSCRLRYCRNPHRI
jgi:transposase